MSGFVFDAKAARAAIAARSVGSANAAVVAVSAVGEYLAVQEPQEPQQPQGGTKLGNASASLSRAEEPQEPQEPQGISVRSQFRAWRHQPQEPQQPKRGRKPAVETSVPTDGHRELIAVGAARGVAAVSAVLAVEGGAVATEAEGLSDSVAKADAVEERAAMAADSVPAIYLDAWARLQVQRPLSVTEDDWRSAVDGAGLFLDAWSEHAASMGWDACNLFDVPRQGRSGGFIWQLRRELSTLWARIMPAPLLVEPLSGEEESTNEGYLVRS